MSDAGDFVLTGELDDVQQWFRSRRLTDGLPIIPPTRARVDAMLAQVQASPDESLGPVPLSRGEATYERLAANAVMAGVEPEAFPVVVAAVRAMLEPKFNLFAIQTTTHPVAPLVIVHGPVARRLNVHAGAGVLGAGWTPNATIGRAIRLILLNVGSTYPGEGDRATQGSPAKFSFCIAENVAESGWAEFHTSRGFSAEESAVTVIGTEAPNNLHDPESTMPTELLEVFVGSMARLGINQWLLSPNEFTIVLCPEHAAILHAAGWQRVDVQNYLFSRAYRSADDLRHGGMWSMRDWPVWMDALAERTDSRFPIVRNPADIHLLVAGGAGKHSSLLPGFGISHAVTVAL